MSRKAEQPSFQEVVGAVERALEEERRLIRDFPAEEVARRLVLGGYPREELTLPRTADAPPSSLGAEEQAFGPDVPTEDA